MQHGRHRERDRSGLHLEARLARLSPAQPGQQHARSEANALGNGDDGGQGDDRLQDRVRVSEALAPFGGRINSLPATPAEILRLLGERG